MRATIRPPAVVVGAALMVVAVSSCAGPSSADSIQNLTPIQGSSYVTIPPATTTTTTTTLVPPGPTTVPPPGSISVVEQVYVVQPNDGPSKIAALFGITMDELITYNAFPEGANHVFFPGDQVRIPPNALVPDLTAAAAAAEEAVTTGTAPCTHTIEAGENPTQVANKYDVTFDQLQNVNPNMDFQTTFVVGDVLAIPAGGTCP